MYIIKFLQLLCNPDDKFIAGFFLQGVKSLSDFGLESANCLFAYKRGGGAINSISSSAISHFIIGAYYGFVAVALITNIFFFSAFRERKIIYYLLFLVTIVLSIAYSDGVISLFANTGIRMYFEPVVHLVAGICGGLFTIQFVGLHKNYFYNQIVFRVFVGLAALFYGMCLASSNPLFFFLGDSSIAVIAAFFWILAITRIKTCKESHYFLFGYTPLLLATLNYYIAQPMGLQIFVVTPAQLKITSIFEMTAFLAFMVYKVSQLKKENRLYNTKIADYVHETAPDLKIADSGTEVNLENFKVIYSLTDSELKVLKCITEGLNNNQISARLFISVNTVKYHIRNIYEKLDINSKSQAICKVMGQAV